jgi:glutaredoxin
MLIVYSKNHCPFCVQAKNWLTQKGVSYTEVNVEQDPAKLAWLKSQGHQSVPQIYTEDDQLFVEGGFMGLAKLSKQQLNERLGELNVSNK